MTDCKLVESFFVEQTAKYRALINQYLQHSLEDMLPANTEADRELKQSVQYSLLQNGKRFRPVLCLLTAQALHRGEGFSEEKVLPLAAAIEMIHTYSLIHDDLPCMDNDDFRRGQPTNHKVFGESTALLAGDCLLTLSFELLAQKFSDNSTLAVQLIRLLSQAAGFVGMIGGQAVDIKAKTDKFSQIDDLLKMHARKTGAMIRICCEGAALIAGVQGKDIILWRKFGEQLGLAFQIKDDLLDSEPEKLEVGSIPELIGWEQTKLLLESTQNQAQLILNELGLANCLLKNMLEYNLSREL